MTALLLALLSVLAAAKPQTQVVSNVATPNSTPSHFVTLVKLGHFDAFCDHGKGDVTFHAPKGESTLVAVAPAGEKAQVQTIDPGTGWNPGAFPFATWQISNFSEGTVYVATVTVSAQPISGAGGACVVTVQGVEQRRPR